MTNATKANIIAAINAAIGLAIAFGAPLSEAQSGAVLVFANAALALTVGLTFRNSAKRINEEV